MFWLRFAVLVAAWLIAAALPLESEALFDDLEARATNVQISFRESHRNDANSWHFALVLHEPGHSAGRLPVFEAALDDKKKCVYYRPNPIGSAGRETTEEQLVATANVVPAKKEKTDIALKSSVKNILLTVTPKGGHPVDPSGFVNCLDWAMMAMRKLQEAKYVTAEGMAPFEKFYNDNAAAVHASRDPAMLKDCGLATRALGGKPNPACNVKAKASRGGTKTSRPGGSKGAAKSPKSPKANRSVPPRSQPPPRNPATGRAKQVARTAPRGRRT